jgi:Serine dehydrogenase proteinase
MAYAKPGSANDFIERQLDEHVQNLSRITSADVLTFCGAILIGTDDIIRSGVDELQRQQSGKKKLVVILTTGGGYIEVVQRIVDTFRKHYSAVDFVVPNYAYSAGTVLVMSGDAIWMDYYSRLGPIDPQVENKSGQMVPALGYLKQYDRLIQKAQGNTITAAEVELLVNGFDQAELYKYEQARDLSIWLLKQWLVQYKFKDWKQTATNKAQVTPKMREDRAAEIAGELNKTERWHTHGHGISMDVLNRDLRLIIDDFGAVLDLNREIKSYYDLLDDYMMKRGDKGILHVDGVYVPFM